MNMKNFYFPKNLVNVVIQKLSIFDLIKMLRKYFFKGLIKVTASFTNVE